MTTDRAMTGAAPYERTVPGFGTVRIRPMDPAGDAEVVHGWVNEDRARFWGMVGHSREQVREIYAVIDSLTTHHAYLALHDDRPAALFQTYQPEHDPLGDHYDVQEGDVGIHLLIGPSRGTALPGYTGHLVGGFLAFLLADPTLRRIVAEPDSRNKKSVARLLRSGFTLGPLIDLPEKRAQLVFLSREKAELIRRTATAR
ncbi:GNAT family N-acetyltransferase [Streptomyces sp. ME19-03-3]|nr:GNAT family N-acetyltransferase [Streptomyces sp. ME19-03-3]